jgi:nuclear migration protein JNM1
MEELETELEQQAQAQKETEGDIEEEETIQDEGIELPRRDDADKTRPKGLARRKKKLPQVNEKGELSPAVLLSQLKRLRGDLGGLQDGQANSGIATNDQDEEEIAGTERAVQRSALLKRLYDQTTLEGSRQDSASEGEASKLTADSGSSSRIDERLEQLEKYVGSNEAPLDEVCFLSQSPSEDATG